MTVPGNYPLDTIFPCSVLGYCLGSVVLKSLSEGVMILDETRIVVFANDAFTKLSGYPQKELLGLTLPELVGLFRKIPGKPEDRDLHLLLKKGAQSMDVPVILARKDGLRIPVLASTSPVVSTAAVVGMVLICRQPSDAVPYKAALA